ncbi:MAG TPA: TonB-dependent receptor [Chitinophagaceae bacterium]|nr:TonB-dependent receptor [Chitinophagaceae bacterium]
MKIILSLILVSIAFPILAQTGKITGKVINSKSGDALIGATVSIEGTQRSAATDLNGIYSFPGLSAGTYTLVVTYVSYTTKNVPGIVVKAGEVTELNISLDETAAVNQAVVVKASRSVRGENTASLLIIQKNSPSTSDGISAEAIKKTPDRNTGDVIRRISGASIQDDKFVIIRGLNDRYNAAFLNGAQLPSSESDRKAFAFDIFPSNILDNVVIYKTATPDMSAEFGGGIINITSKSIPAKNFTTLSLGVGYNTIATFKDRVGYDGGKTDFIGLDDGTRAMPKGIPSVNDFNKLLPADKAQYAKLFANNWGLKNGKTFPYSSVQFSTGRNFERLGRDFLGVLFSLSYSDNPAYTYNEKNSYEYDRQAPSTPPAQRNKYADDIYSDKTLAGAMLNFSLKLSPKNTLSWKNMLSINSEDRLVLRGGYPDFDGDASTMARIHGRWFTSNVIFTSQLTGSHILNKSNFRMDWEGALSRVKRSIPDLRQSVYISSASSGSADYYADVASGTLSPDNGGTHFYSSTDERIYSGKVDFTQPFHLFGNSQNLFKFGGGYQKRSRTFDARLLGFGAYNVGSVYFDYDLLTLPENEIYAPANLGGQLSNGKGGFTLIDGTKPTYSYTASSGLAHGYVMADQRFGKKLRAVYGLRYEWYKQNLNSFIDYGVPVTVDTKKGDLLPSANLIFSVTTKQNLRLSFSQTINRPEFRELAPFTFFDFVTRYTIQGDTALVRTLINNFDLRYEIYPGRAQLFSVSAFYKYFDKPIELVSSPNSNNTAIYQNAKSARVLGFEAEMRTLLSTIFNSREGGFLDKLTLAFNASIISSEIRVSDYLNISAKDLIAKRDLQGQSPYLLNGSLTYADDNSGFSSTLSLNRAGPRIYIVGTVNDLDIYEQPRTSLDFQVGKSFKDGKWELKLNAKDLLAQKLTYFYDVNQDKKYSASVDKIFSRNTFGRVISLTATYKF